MVICLANGIAATGVLVVKSSVKAGKARRIGSREAMSWSQVAVRSRQMTVVNVLLVARLARRLCRRRRFSSPERVVSWSRSDRAVILLYDRSNVCNH